MQTVLAAVIGVGAVLVLSSPILFGLWKGRHADMLATVPSSAWRLSIVLCVILCIAAVVGFVAAT